MGNSEQEFLEYILRTFPGLLLHVWRVVLEHREEPDFKPREELDLSEFFTSGFKFRFAVNIILSIFSSANLLTMERAFTLEISPPRKARITNPDR